MRQMLPDYYSYVLENPDTLLMRILGQYDLTHDSNTYHLVVLANVFNTSLDIHERFDLKVRRLLAYSPIFPTLPTSPSAPSPTGKLKAAASDAVRVAMVFGIAKGSRYKRTLGKRRGTPGLVHRDLDFIQTGRRITGQSLHIAGSICQLPWQRCCLHDIAVMRVHARVEESCSLRFSAGVPCVCLLEGGNCTAGA